MKEIAEKVDSPDLLPPPENRRLLVAQSYSGPIPPASELQKYEAMMPGAADRIFKMAEKEQDILDKRAVLEAKTQKLGFVLGFFSFLLVVCLAAFSLYLKQMLVSVSLVAMISFCGYYVNKKH